MQLVCTTWGIQGNPNTSLPSGWKPTKPTKMWVTKLCILLVNTSISILFFQMSKFWHANKAYWSLCYQQSKVGELPPRDSVYKAVWLPGGTCVWLCGSNVVIILLNSWLGNISKQSLEIFLESGDKTFPGSSCRSYVLDVHRFKWRITTAAYLASQMWEGETKNRSHD